MILVEWKCLNSFHNKEFLVHLTLIDVIGKYGINFVYNSKRFKAKITLRLNTLQTSNKDVLKQSTLKHACDEKMAMTIKCPPLRDSRWFVAFVIGLLTLAPVTRVKNQRKINIQQSFSIQVMTFPSRAQLWFLWTSTSIFELFPLSDRCLLFSLLSTSLFCRFLNWFNSRKQYCNILQYFSRRQNDSQARYSLAQYFPPVMEVRHWVESSSWGNLLQ